MNKNVHAGFPGDEAETQLVFEPFDFSAGHNEFPFVTECGDAGIELGILQRISAHSPDVTPHPNWICAELVPTITKMNQISQLLVSGRAISEVFAAERNQELTSAALTELGCGLRNGTVRSMTPRAM